MLTIRKEQMEALDAHMMRQYEGRVLRRIKRTFPDLYQQQGEEKLLLLIRAGVRKAERHGITEDDDVEKFILILVEHGLDFEAAPERVSCKDILEEKTLPGDAKVCLLLRELHP